MSVSIPLQRRAIAILGGRRFFVFVVALLALQAAWIALSGRYPMAFDENFHLGLIQLYTHHLNPFLPGQPPGADAFGAVARDTSYLYHYLMSFPYRIIEAMTRDQTLQVLVLRAMNIALFAYGLGLWRRLLLRVGASKAVVHLCLLIFVLIPVVPLLAAQINYDNLLFPIVAIVLMWTIDFNSKLTKEKRVDAGLLLRLMILCVLTSLIKYAFLPIFIAVLVYVTLGMRRRFGSWCAVYGRLLAGLRRLSTKAKLFIGTALTVSLLLFGQRYGVNVVRYHNPVPACDKVLSVESCLSYGPWARDHRYKAEKTHTPHNPLAFTWDWLYGMWLRLFFAVDGPDTNFQTKGPLTVPGLSAIAFTVAGVILVAAYGRRVFQKYDADVLKLTILVAALYIAVLWLNQFSAYMSTGRPVAINGRYLIPVVLPLILLGGLAANEFLKGSRRIPDIRLALAGVAVFSLVWGGGVLTYILRSNDAWYWDNAAVRGSNHAVQRTVGPLVPGYRHPGQYLH